MPYILIKSIEEDSMSNKGTFKNIEISFKKNSYKITIITEHITKLQCDFNFVQKYVFT